jgi:PDZ domain-containing protein
LSVPARVVQDRSTPQLAAAVLIALGVIVGIIWPVPYVVLSPGPVIDVLGSNQGKALITISGAPIFPTSGQLDLTTVSESGGPHGRVPLSRVFGGWVDPSVAVVPTRLLYPDNESSQQLEQENTAQMLQSQDSAAVAALRHLGIPVTLTVSVASVDKGEPAAGKLQANDQILRIDGTAVSTGADVTAAVRKRKPGETVLFEVRRSGATVRVPVVAAARPDEPTVAYVGIVTKDGYTSPVKVTISLEDVGGPSAGLMFTLGIVD